MSYVLADRLRVEARPNVDRRSTRVFLGASELALDGPSLAAVLQVCGGGAVGPDALRRLVELGVLVAVPTPSPRGPLRLRPEVAVEIGFGAQAGVSPQLTLPVMAFVPPEVLGPLQDLGSRLRHGWDLMVRATHGADRALDRGEMARRLAKVAAHELARRPELASVLEVTDTAPWTARSRVELQRDEVQYPVHWISLAVAGAGPPVRIEVRTADAVRAVGELLADLATGAPGEALEARWRTPVLRAALHQIVGRGMCFDGPGLEPPALGEVVHLGHATLWANLGERVIIDPWFPGGRGAGSVVAPSWGALGPIAAVFFTHHHWDHVDPATMLSLPKDVPVYVPAQPTDRPLVPRTAAWLRWWGFRRVVELRHGERVQFSDGHVVAAPFTGEDPSDLGFGGNTYVLGHRGRAALVHVDAGPTLAGRSLLSDGTMAALVAEHGPLSPVFATRRQERGTLIEHGWPFLLQPSDRWTQPVENCATGAAFLRDLCRGAGATELVLYSEGGAPWYPAGTDFLQDADDAPWTDVVTYLWDDLAAIRAAVEPTARVRTSRVYDRFSLGGNTSADGSHVTLFDPPTPRAAPGPARTWPSPGGPRRARRRR